MRLDAIIAALLILSASATAQPPAILPHGVVNAASLMPPGLDAGAVAPGSRVRISGLRLTGGHVLFGDLDARVLATSATTIEAIVPPSVAPGDVMVRIRTAADTSEPLRVRVVGSSFGIYDATHVEGRRYRLRGTGLGNEKNPRVILGATTPAANVRVISSTDGIDEIEFDLPNDAPPALNTAVQVIAGGFTSNSVFLPPNGIAPGWLDLSSARRIGAAVLLRADFDVRAQSGEWIALVDDEAAAVFVNSEAGLRTELELPPAPGTCATYATYYYPDTASRSLAATLGTALHDRTAWQTAPTVSLIGPKGERRLPSVPNAPGVYGGSVGGESPENGLRDRPLFLDPGDYTLTAGGVRIRVSAGGKFAWTNRHAVSEVRRDRGFRVDWRGATNGRVMIVVVDASEFSGATGVAWCVPGPGSRSFTVPPAALANIGPTREGTLPTSLVIVMEVSPLASTTTPDGDRLLGASVQASGRSVTFR